MLERGEVANSWRRERWDSLRLLTPNWLSRLPGLRYEGQDPDGYMSAAEVAEFIELFAKVSRAPVRTGVNVTSVRLDGDGYRVATSDGEIACRAVVLASGACNRPSVPALSQAVPAVVEQLTPFDYRGPGDSSRTPACSWWARPATERPARGRDQAAGRTVGACPSGEHRAAAAACAAASDVLWWMEAAGVWDQRYVQVDDLARARRQPSPQLVGTPERVTLDLNALSALGVELVGRLAVVRDGRALFSGGLRNVFSLADLKMNRLLGTFDEWALTSGRDGEFLAPERPAPTRAPASARLQLDLTSGEVSGGRLGDRLPPRLRVARRPGDSTRRASCGTTAVSSTSPGLYALGLPVLRRRKSTFIYGIEDDAREVIDHLAGYLAARG